MNSETDPIRIIEASRFQHWADSVDGFLHQLGRASLILIPGQDSRRTRALCTLLHGNEPSGVKALHQLLRSGVTPSVNMVCLVLAVETALHETLFQHRYLPGERDMNRCFRPPFDDRPGRIARHALELLASYRPECIVDVHNTSGSGPAFGVVAHEDYRHEALVSLFTEHLVVTDLRLGAIMELSTPECPIVTVECGGAADPRADRIAVQGIGRYMRDEQVLALPAGLHLELYHRPVRLELAEGCRLAFDTRAVPGVDLTVPPDLERYNFGTAPSGTFIGWLDTPSTITRLRAYDGQGQNRLQEWFTVVDGRLLTTQPLKLFMVTHRVDIALSDCLFYAAPETEHRRLDS